MAFTPSNMIGTSRTDGVSNKDLALKVFSGEVLTAFNTKNIFMDLIQTRTISNGKSAQFPIIGKTGTGASTHVPGNDVSIDTVASSEKTITIDGLKTSAIFVDNYEETMAHYEVRSEYSRQIGETLAKDIDAYIITNLDACIGGTAGAGQPAVKASAEDAGILDTDTAAQAGDKLLATIFKGQAELDGKDVPGERYIVMTPADKYNLVQSNAINKDYTSGVNGGLDNGMVDSVAGMKVLVSNNVAANTVYIFTANAVGAVKLLDLKTESNYIPEKLGTLIVSSFAMGFGVLNPGCVYKIDTTASA